MLKKTLPPLYCSNKCAKSPIVRSFGTCPECNEHWNSDNNVKEQHYRNNAWKICDTCSREQNRCVVCGDAVAS